MLNNIYEKIKKLFFLKLQWNVIRSQPLATWGCTNHNWSWCSTFYHLFLTKYFISTIELVGGNLLHLGCFCGEKVGFQVGTDEIRWGCKILISWKQHTIEKFIYVSFYMGQLEHNKLLSSLLFIWWSNLSNSMGVGSGNWHKFWIMPYRNVITVTLHWYYVTRHSDCMADKILDCDVEFTFTEIQCRVRWCISEPMRKQWQGFTIDPSNTQCVRDGNSIFLGVEDKGSPAFSMTRNKPKSSCFCTGATSTGGTLFIEYFFSMFMFVHVAPTSDFS